MPSEHVILGLLLVGQTIVSAITISLMTHQLGYLSANSRELSKEVRYVAEIVERILNRVEGNP